MSEREQEAEYDAIADAYRESKQHGFREVIEAHTLRELWGDVTGLRVVDLACGEGFHTRRLKQAGAASVLGVDLSGEMIALAEAEERRAPLGCEYRQADVASLGLEPVHDLVSAAYLLNYANSAELLRRFCAAVHAALRPGGRFVGFNDNVNRNAALGPSFAPYGFEKRCRRDLREGDEIVYDLRRANGEVFSVVNFYLSPATYAEAFAAAGLVDFCWEGPYLDPTAAGDPFWELFMLHAPLIGFSARKP